MDLLRPTFSLRARRAEKNLGSRLIRSTQPLMLPAKTVYGQERTALGTKCICTDVKIYEERGADWQPSDEEVQHLLLLDECEE